MVLVQPLWDAPALRVDHTLVVCDIHLGIEYEMYTKGIRMGSLTDRIKGEIEALLTEDITRLILLGDIKHNVPNVSWHEEREVPGFVDFSVPVEIVKGNHDGGIESLVDCDVKNEIVMNGIVLTHGHRALDNPLPPLLVVGHSHPAVEFQDELGSRTKEKCWILGYTLQNTRVIIMPAFNPVIRGVAVNSDPRIPGVLFSQNLLDESRCDIYLLDGTYLGTLKTLR
ncbi:MAG: metallophosphoesterase [Theionarchaea archaeon]|nr:metallophosphoesterase [Theionarchaea archaeon]MBU7000109.1 metallophosphoesterase [Theionarchaea archaeon]MBU7020826.1 metallophosphoesterase [Theionarchaea archaeon]MBU7033938.1 metallophosphoesterase [Theionarchaea archaeon]MBU7039234.1 metallophosphoesterase [Theionarchaea archaeon]